LAKLETMHASPFLRFLVHELNGCFGQMTRIIILPISDFTQWGYSICVTVSTPARGA